MTANIGHVNHSPQMLSNVMRLTGQITALQGQDRLSERMGCFFGHPGSGKSVATGLCRNEFDAVIVEVGETWTRKVLVEELCIELDIAAKGTLHNMYKQIVERLSYDPKRPILIDEADKLVNGGMIEIVRQIYDATRNPVILVGEEELPNKLALIPRMHDRVVSWVPAEPCNSEDMDVLAKVFCPDVILEPELLQEILRISSGKPRLIGNNLTMVNEHFAITSADRISLDDVASKLLSGGTPTARANTKAGKR